MNIEYRKFSEFQREIIYELLRDGYYFYMHGPKTYSRIHRNWS